MKIAGLHLLKIVTASVLLLFVQHASRVQAGEIADRVITAVQVLQAEGKLGQNPVLRLMVKKGNLSNFTGDSFQLKRRWEKQTGVQLDIQVMPQQASLDLIRTDKDVDLAVARNREFPDLYNQGLVLDLVPLMHKYGFTLDSDTESGFILPEKQVYFGDRIIGIPADNDIALLYLRRDMLEADEYKAAFRERYGQELAAPNTWDDYLRLVEFFNHPEKGFYGSLEPRNESTAWMYWMPRYLSKGDPVRYLFDDAMQPLIDSPEGIKATKEYLSTITYAPPKLLRHGNDYNFTLPLFRYGQGFSTIITAAGAKIFNIEGSPVRGKFAVYLMPGDLIDGKLIRRTTYIYGNNMVITSSSKNSDLAFLYAMWLTDPDISTQSIVSSGGFSDPYRFNHLKQPSIRKRYSSQLIDALVEQINIAVPAGTGLPGDTEYISVLNENLRRAVTGAITATEAMQLTATAWEEITERHGRNQQIGHLQVFRRHFPQ